MLGTHILFWRKKLTLLLFGYLVNVFRIYCSSANLSSSCRRKVETTEIGENLPPSISLSHSYTHSFIYSLFLSFCLSPSITHKLILSLPWKTAQQHEIVYYSITLVPFFFFHFSLCMPYKEEKMLLYALTPSTIFRKKILTKRGLKL